MCLTCGCLFGGKGNKLRFKVEGYTKENAKELKEFIFMRITVKQRLIIILLKHR